MTCQSNYSNTVVTPTGTNGCSSVSPTATAYGNQVNYLRMEMDGSCPSGLCPASSHFEVKFTGVLNYFTN